MDLDDPAAYGEAFADVYDEWYGAEPDTEAAVARLEELAAGGRVLELGVGTGRLAIPLAARGLEVHGVDASPAMLRRLEAKPGGPAVLSHLGDLVDGGPPGPFQVVVLARNTLFNVADAARQQQCLANAADRLGDGGALVVEAFVPDVAPPPSGLEVGAVTTEAVRLMAWRHEADGQTLVGQHVTITEDGNRLRPFRLRHAGVDELDGMAAAAGLAVAARWAGWSGEPFTDASSHHVTAYRRSR